MTLIYVHYVPYVFSVESPAGPAAERVGGIRDAPAAPAPPLHRSAGLAPSQTGSVSCPCAPSSNQGEDGAWAAGGLIK